VAQLLAHVVRDEVEVSSSHMLCAVDDGGHVGVFEHPAKPEVHLVQ
jgi:hypothetical protein